MLDIKRIIVKKIIKNTLKLIPFNFNSKIHIVFEAPRKFHYFHMQTIVNKIILDNRFKVTIVKWTDFCDEDKIEGVTYKSFEDFWHDWFNLYDIFVTTEFERKPSWFVDGTSICMMHGAGAKMGPLKTPAINDYDVIFSVGPMTYEVQKAYVNDSVIIEKVGLPATDILTAKNTSLLPKSISIDKTKPTLLYAPSWAYDPTNISMDNEILNEISKIKDFNVIIRPHPNLLNPNSCNGYDWNIKINKLKSNGVQVSYSEDHSVYELLPHIDIMIGDISSVTFEYLIFNKPIILYLKEGVLDAYDAKEFKDPLLSSTTRLIDASSLTEILNNINKNEDLHKIARAELLNNMLFNVGQATQSAITVIEKYAFET